jgi:hypothetical protein
LKVKDGRGNKKDKRRESGGDGKGFKKAKRA